MERSWPTIVAALHPVDRKSAECPSGAELPHGAKNVYDYHSGAVPGWENWCDRAAAHPHHRANLLWPKQARRFGQGPGRRDQEFQGCDEGPRKLSWRAGSARRQEVTVSAALLATFLSPTTEAVQPHSHIHLPHGGPRRRLRPGSRTPPLCPW